MDAAKVADLIGAPSSLNVVRWEQGSATPSSYYVKRLCQIFGKSVFELGLLVDETQMGPLWNVPYRRNPFFTGRTDLLAQLGEELRVERAAALTQSYALSGLGGIGNPSAA